MTVIKASSGERSKFDQRNKLGFRGTRKPGDGILIVLLGGHLSVV